MKIKLKNLKKTKPKIKKKSEKKKKQTSFLKKQLLIHSNQNCHNDCTYYGIERSTCPTLE